MKSPRRTRSSWGALLVFLIATGSLFVAGGTAVAAPTRVGLGAATDYAIRAGSGVTNSGATCVPPQVIGTMTQVSAGGPTPCTQTNAGAMTTVENDARTAFNHTSGLSGATPTDTDLATLSPLVSGLYSFGHDPTSNINGTLTLDAQGDPDAVWIFQASSDLVTASGSTVQFVNAPIGSNLACNVFWTVGSSATINSGSTFVGTILASASITVGSGATVKGRLLAANAAGANGNVTLIDDTIIRPTGCTTLETGTGGTPTPPEGTPTTPGSPTRPGSPTSPGSPTGPGSPTSPGSPGTPSGPGTPGAPPVPATPVGLPPKLTG
jgi:Ice-binding-like